MRLFHTCCLVIAAALTTACQNVQQYDYSAIETAKPRSILVIPPINESMDVNAPY
ncbi:MAG: GNA1162 family protein, partial [Spongiibacteraceae bacterium]